MKSFFIAPPVGGGRSRKLYDPPLVALRSRRRSSECDSCTAGDWGSGNAAFALSRGSRGTAPSASPSDSVGWAAGEVLGFCRVSFICPFAIAVTVNRRRDLFHPP